VASAASACAQCAPSAELSPGAQLSPAAQSAATVRSAPPLAVSAAPDPLADFRSAVAALSAGDNREAATRFARFLAKHPRDPQAEDASYLRVIALQRCGDTASMKQAAVEYMRSYPRGFRHADVEALVGDLDSTP
jgi:TolA-binding protein